MRSILPTLLFIPFLLPADTIIGCGSGSGNALSDVLKNNFTCEQQDAIYSGFTLLSGTYEAGTTVEMFFQQVGTTEYDTLQVTGNLDKAFSIGYTITVDAARNLDGILTSVGANLGSAVPIGTPTLTVSSRSFATFSVTKSSGAAFGPLAGVRTLSIVDALDPQGGAANSLTNSFTETVPEPSAVVLVGACLTIMGLKRWYRTR